MREVVMVGLASFAWYWAFKTWARYRFRQTGLIIILAIQLRRPWYYATYIFNLEQYVTLCSILA